MKKEDSKNYDPFTGVALAKLKEVKLMAQYFKDKDKAIKKKRIRDRIRKFFGLEV